VQPAITDIAIAEIVNIFFISNCLLSEIGIRRFLALAKLHEFCGLFSECADNLVGTC